MHNQTSWIYQTWRVCTPLAVLVFEELRVCCTFWKHYMGRNGGQWSFMNCRCMEAKQQWNIKPQISTDLLATGSALCFCRTGTEGLRVAPAALAMSGLEADCVMVWMLLPWRMGDSKLAMLPLRRGGEAERVDDSILVMSLSCSGFLSPPSGACRRAVNHTFTHPNVQPTGDKLILAYVVIYCEYITLAVTAQQSEMGPKRSLVFVMKIVYRQSTCS